MVSVVGIPGTAQLVGMSTLDDMAKWCGLSGDGADTESEGSALKPPHDMGPDIGWDRPGGDLHCWNVPGASF